MKVILRQDVDKVGLRGEVVDVARGYARNFLLPRKLAEPATDARVAELEKVNANRARHEAQTFDEAQDIGQRLGETELRFDVKAGDTGVLFGSVTATDVADLLWDRHKIRVDRKKIDLGEPIKRIGRYEVPIELFQDVTATVNTQVVPEGGELPSDEELAAMEAQERGEPEAAAEPEAAEPTLEEVLAAEDEAEEPQPVAEAEPEVVAEAEAGPELVAEAEAEPAATAEAEAEPAATAEPEAEPTATAEAEAEPEAEAPEQTEEPA
jgi:large subunit ribosomal protein L9